MKVRVAVVGSMRRQEVHWPDGWPAPRIGDGFTLPDADEVTTVRAVDWFPEGEDDNMTPFVYVVVGPRSPR
jgi:hypothetical protein